MNGQGDADPEHGIGPRLQRLRRRMLDVTIQTISTLFIYCTNIALFLGAVFGDINACIVCFTCSDEESIACLFKTLV